MRSTHFTLRLILLSINSIAAAADNLSFDSAQLTVRLSPRTPQQMAAFYEARGFSREMIDILNEHCFITVSIDNKSDDIIWLDLNQWQFKNINGTVIREDRTYWRERWTNMHIPLAHQSTFRWTLLPEQLDFRPGEYEGGNIIMPRRGKPMTITATFNTGEKHDAAPIQISFNNVQCAENP